MLKIVENLLSDRGSVPNPAGELTAIGGGKRFGMGAKSQGVWVFKVVTSKFYAFVW